MADGEAWILVADDEPLVLGVVVNALELAGYKVVKAKDGAEALKVCQADHRQIDLALLDYFMPGMNGTELFERLREIYPQIKVIMMSGYTELLLRKMKEDLKIVGVDGVLPKPFLPAQLIAKVKTTLESR